MEKGFYFIIEVLIANFNRGVVPPAECGGTLPWGGKSD